MKNDDDDENNDKNEDIKNGLLDDFNDLILFGFSENPFKAPNLSFDRRTECRQIVNSTHGALHGQNMISLSNLKLHSLERRD